MQVPLPLVIVMKKVLVSRSLTHTNGATGVFDPESRMRTRQRGIRYYVSRTPYRVGIRSTEYVPCRSRLNS